MSSPKERWALVAAHLEAAFSPLPTSPSESPDRVRVAQFKEFLFQNELALALDELEGLGESNSVQAELWTRLLAAAEEMGLQSHAIRYRQRGA